MPGVYLTTTGTRVGLHSERLHVEIPGHNEGDKPTIKDVPLHDVERVVLTDGVAMTTVALALDLLSHGTLKAREHFENREGGVYLNQDGRRRFFVAYERRMERDFVSEQTGTRTSLRGEFQRQALAVKQAVLNDEPFIPFLMN